MLRNLAIIAALVVVVALPFIFRKPAEVEAWRPGDPELIVITPHNEAIRREFARAFSAWHQRRYGRPVKVDWRNLGGTTEIMRYLNGQYVAAFRAWWREQDRDWPVGGGGMILDRKFKPDAPPAFESEADREAWERRRDLYTAFRAVDDAPAFSSGIDLFFGGGAYDHGKASAQGMLVAPWSNGPPAELLRSADGVALIPEKLGGERWRDKTWFGNALSTFGICYNRDRLADLGIDRPPERWDDLGDPRWFGHLGVADPTKSGSIAKAFEMIVHDQVRRALHAAGFDEATIADYEGRIADARGDDGVMPEGVPAAYQQAVEEGWLNGLLLLRRIGANARYFTDASGKVPIDVASGAAAAGVVIDFYGRTQAEITRDEQGEERMIYVTPRGGSSVSADPIGLLRGAPNRETAVRFIAFVLGEEGQRLWNARPGSPGGPERYALRRLPIRRDFYPSDDPALDAAYRANAAYYTDPLGDEDVDPYRLAQSFVYYPRWTSRHFGFFRDFVRAMCLDAGEELKAAWKAILEAGGPEAQPDAMALLEAMPGDPEPIAWVTAPSLGKRHERMDLLKAWTLFFRDRYEAARRRAEEGTEET